MLPIVKTKMDQKFITVPNTNLVKKELLRYYGVDSTVANMVTMSTISRNPRALGPNGFLGGKAWKITGRQEFGRNRHGARKSQGEIFPDS
jgi:hypothetical protein